MLINKNPESPFIINEYCGKAFLAFARILLASIPNKQKRKEAKRLTRDLVEYRFDPVKSLTLLTCCQYKLYQENTQSVQTIILGSSHGRFAFIPKTPSEINLSFNSADLYYIKKQIEKTITQTNAKLYILFFSTFHSGYILQKSSLAADPITSSIHLLWNIEYNPDGEVSEKELEMCNSVKKYINYNYDNITPNYDYYTQLSRQQMQDDTDKQIVKFKNKEMFFENSAKNRATGHQKFSTKNTELKHLDSIIDIINQNGRKLVIITPPLQQILL